MSQPLNIVFAGTPDFSVPPLQSLIESEHRVIAVYTQPDRPAGRGRKLTAGPVKQLALANDIPVYQPASLKDPEALHQLQALNADLMVVVAYGLLLPRAVIETPRLGCINIHASLLPRWRGAAPIQRAILAGDRETGITIMRMDEGLDTGPMLLKKTCPIGEQDTASSLHDRLSLLGAEALMEALPGIIDGSLKDEAQDDSQASYAAKLQKSESLLDWRLSAEELARQVRGLNGWPVAQTTLVDNGKQQVMRIWEADAEDARVDAAPGSVVSCDRRGIRVAAGEGVLCLTRIQLPGGRPVAARDFANARDLSGCLLGSG